MKSKAISTSFACIAGLWLSLGTAVSSVSTAWAQSGPGLILSPWEEHQHFDVEGLALFEEGDTDAQPSRFTLRLYQSQGRGRLSTQRGAPVGGYDVTYLNFTSADPAVPDHLSDQSLAIGLGLGRWHGFEFAATVGGGYASDSFYPDEDAWYPKASLIVSRRLPENGQLFFTLSYDGNRSFLPDLPLPGIAYSNQYGPELSYTIGFPFSSIRWQPTDRWKLTFNYGIPLSVSGQAQYLLNDRWSVFAGYDTHISAFHLDGDDEHRRLFFEQNRVEVGTKWRLFDQSPLRSNLTLAVGYAFGQELSRGYDLRDTQTLRDLNESAFVRLGLSFDF